MIIKRTWKRKFEGYYWRYHYTGYFLFGIIPLYINREEV